MVTSTEIQILFNTLSLVVNTTFIENCVLGKGFQRLSGSSKRLKKKQFLASFFYSGGFHSPVVLTSMNKILHQNTCKTLYMLGGNTTLRFHLTSLCLRMALHTALCEKHLSTAFQGCVCDSHFSLEILRIHRGKSIRKKKYRHNNTQLNVKPENKVAVNILEMENYKQKNYCVTVIPESTSRQLVWVMYIT